MVTMRTKAVEFEIVSFCLTMMERKHCKKRESYGNGAILALERAIGDGEDWLELTTIIIKMMGSRYSQLLKYSSIAFDHLHDILCKEYPEQDDGIRYIEVMANE